MSQTRELVDSGLSDAFGGCGEIVGLNSKLNVRSKQEPIRSWFPKWHPHAARIYNPNFSDHSIKLHVGMTADDNRHIESLSRKSTSASSAGIQ